MLVKMFNLVVVLVVLPDPFGGMGAWINYTELQQAGHAPRSGPEVKNGRSSAKDGAPERLGYGTVKEEVSRILQRVPQALHEEFSFLHQRLAASTCW